MNKEIINNVLFYEENGNRIAILHHDLIEKKQVGNEYIYAEKGELNKDFKDRVQSIFFEKCNDSSRSTKEDSTI